MKKNKGFFSKKGILAVIFIALSLIALGCNGGGGGKSASTTTSTLRSTASVSTDGTVTVANDLADTAFNYDVTHNAGGPETVTYTFSTYASDGEIELINGGDSEPKGGLVSSAHVVLNGVEIFGPSDFNQNVDELEKDITLLEGVNTLEVTIDSSNPDGAKVTIGIEQETDNDSAEVDTGEVDTDADVPVVVP